jgi:hypothetical protein
MKKNAPVFTDAISNNVRRRVRMFIRFPPFICRPDLVLYQKMLHNKELKTQNIKLFIHIVYETPNMCEGGQYKETATLLSHHRDEYFPCSKFLTDSK